MATTCKQCRNDVQKTWERSKEPVIRRTIYLQQYRSLGRMQGITMLVDRLHLDLNTRYKKLDNYKR